jgi:hypothetical protein
MRWLRRNAVILLALLVPLIYCAAYSVVCPRYDGGGGYVTTPGATIRYVDHRWEGTFWAPLIDLEYRLRGKDRFVVSGTYTLRMSARQLAAQHGWQRVWP